MSDLRALYQEVLLDHSRRPRNFGELARPTGRAEGHNPLCGDRVTIEVASDGERLREIAIRGTGCAISTASASLMSEAVQGLSLAEIAALSERFRDLLTRKGTGDPEDLGKLQVFAGVADFPMRVKCATLPWHALEAALAGEPLVSTE